MKCPKCGYISFDDLSYCKRCGTSLLISKPPNVEETFENIKKILKEIDEIESVDTHLQSLQKAGFWLRLIAYGIDNFLLFVLSVVFFLIRL